MNIAVLNETGESEARVALMPDSVQKLVAAKASISIESDAGLGAARTDDDYRSVTIRISAVKLKVICFLNFCEVRTRIAHDFVVVTIWQSHKTTC